MKIRSLAVVLLFGMLGQAHAGSAGAPRLVWVDLEKNHPATQAIKDFVNSQPEDIYCDGDGYGLAFYIDKRPAGLTNSLVRQAVVANNARAKAAVLQIMRSFKDADEGIKDGLDGVVVFVDLDGLRMISMDARGKIARSAPASLQSPHSLSAALCSVTPMNYRDHG